MSKTKINLLVNGRVIEKIRNLRALTDWHPSVLPVFDQWEKQIESLELDAEFLALPKVKELSSMLESRVRAVDSELKTNRFLTDLQRINLFAIKDIAELELSLFSPQSLLQSAKSVEQEVDEETQNFWASEITRNENGA